MNESEENFGFEDKRLSLIDVSFEDDCLYNSPSRDFQFHHCSGNENEQKRVRFLGLENASNELTSGDGADGEEQAPKPVESSEPDGKRENVKYNLRKSLAWDAAFFTSAGVLEPEELSSMIGGEKRGKDVLPQIEEEIHRSTDSLSTLSSENLTLETPEVDLFEDIRASIQKSSKAFNVAKPNSRGEVDFGMKQSQITQSSEKVDIASENKLKAKAVSKKPNAVMHGSEKITKQCVATHGGSKSLCRPPKAVGRVSPILTPATKRASLGANCIKVEKEDAKISTGRGAKISALGGSRNAVPRPALLSRSSLSSSLASKTEVTASASLNSSGSSSSDGSKSSLSSVRRKIDSRTSNRSSSGSTVKTALKITSRSKNQSTSSHLSPYLKSVTKLSSSISPASSISEWSSESLSPTSTLNKRSSSSRSSLDTSSCKDSSGDGEAPQILDLQTHSNDKCSVGHDNQLGLPAECVKKVPTASSAVICPDSSKPSGLRMPSPKIGFFDGVKSAVRTPNRSMQTHPPIPSGLPRIRAGSASPSGGSSNAKLGKLQHTRTVKAVRGMNIVAQQPASDVQPKSPVLLQEPSNAAPKVCSASRTDKRHSGTSSKVQNRMSPKPVAGSDLMVEKVTSKECNIAAKGPNSGFNERCSSLGVLKDEMILSEDNASAKDIKITPTKGLFTTASNSNSISVPENITLTRKVDEKEHACFGDQIDDLTKQLGAADILGKIQKESVGDPFSICKISISKEFDSGVQEEFLKSSKPTSSPAPATGSTVLESSDEDSHLNPCS